MKTFRIITICILTFCICVASLGCSSKPDLQTAEDAIAYLEEYIEKEDKWDPIATEIDLSWWDASLSDFDSSSTAEMQDGVWFVVLHGSMTGYTDYGKTDRKTAQFSYIANVTTDGLVTELYIVPGHVVEIY